MLEAVNVAHHRLGELGEVAMGEERERQLAKALCQARAGMAHFVVDHGVGVVVLLIVRNKREREEADDAGYVREGLGQWGAFREGCHVVLHEQKQEPDAGHYD
jgi:hypothetical protein